MAQSLLALRPWIIPRQTMLTPRQRLKQYLTGGLVTLVISVATYTTAIAAGELMVTPTRVVFEPRTRTAQVTLVNQGNETGNFRISFIRQNMTENGDFVAVAESEAGLYSDPMIRYSPRQVSLPPGQAQVIRLLLRKPANLTGGEYRSHLLFQALPPPASTSVDNVASENIDGISIELIPIVGVSIPVIVRHGELNSTVTLTNPEITLPEDSSGSPALSVEINRRGNSSSYGDIRVMFTPNDGQPLVIAQANSVAIYANMERRVFQLALNIPPGVRLSDGVLDIVYMKSGSGAEPDNIAETSLILN